MSNERDVYGPLYDVVRQYPCAFHNLTIPCFGQSGPHHVKTVGSGGRDHENVIPVCMAHHSMLHGQYYGITAKDFCEEHGIDLDEVAKEYTAKALGHSDTNLDF